jgi:hypothetical protein
MEYPLDSDFFFQPTGPYEFVFSGYRGLSISATAKPHVDVYKSANGDGYAVHIKDVRALHPQLPSPLQALLLFSSQNNGMLSATRAFAVSSVEYNGDWVHPHIAVSIEKPIKNGLLERLVGPFTVAVTSSQ